MPEIDAYISSIRSRLIATGLPASRLSKMAGLSEMALRNFASDRWRPTVDTLRKLEDLLSRLEQETSSAADQVAA